MTVQKDIRIHVRNNSLHKKGETLQDSLMKSCEMKVKAFEVRLKWTTFPWICLWFTYIMNFALSTMATVLSSLNNAVEYTKFSAGLSGIAAVSLLLYSTIERMTEVLIIVVLNYR
jgi:hypothetical protein